MDGSAGSESDDLDLGKYCVDKLEEYEPQIRRPGPLVCLSVNKLCKQGIHHNPSVEGI